MSSALEDAENEMKTLELVGERDSPELIQALELYALELRKANRLLDAVNIEARVKKTKSNLATEVEKGIAAKVLTKAKTKSLKHAKESRILVAILVVYFVVAGIIQNWPGALSGAVWITRGNGSSEMLRGFSIYLCDASSQDLMHQIAQKLRSEGSTSALEITQLLDDNLKSHILRSAETDELGHYHLTNLARGEYVLYAKFDNHYSRAFWWLPVSVSSPFEIKLDLRNSNMAASENDR